MAGGAVWGSRAARPGVVIPGAAPAPEPPATWPPAGLTTDEKLDLVLKLIGSPRYDLLPGDYSLTDLLLVSLGIQEP